MLISTVRYLKMKRTMNEHQKYGNKTGDDSQHNDMQWETRYESFIYIIFLDLFTVLFIFRNPFLFLWWCKIIIFSWFERSLHTVLISIALLGNPSYTPPPSNPRPANPPGIDDQFLSQIYLKEKLQQLFFSESAYLQWHKV